MTSTQRYLANNRNVLLNATLAATSVSAIENAVLEKPLARDGSARVALSGAYTGHDEAQYEIEIADNIVSTPLVSQPIFAGAGTGAIGGIGFTGTAQTFTVKLADLGQVLTAAGTDMEGVSLEARTPGAGGNLIRLTVDLSGLVYTASDYSLIQPLPVGANGVEGPQWDWDTRIMGADGQIPAGAHRMTFGEDTSTVYRQYKAYKDGKWLYRFEPPLKTEVAAGARVRFVTGGRTVTLTDGTATETYPGIVTLYDLLSAIQTASALVKVEGVVSNDRSPGGMAARDLATRTDAHCLPSYGKGSAFAAAMTNYSAMPGAKTELVEARCWAVSSKDHPDAGIGKELWQVKGSVSGVVDTALKTGTPLALADRFGFTIPTRLPDGFGVPRGRFSLTDIAYASRNATAGETQPPICVEGSLVLGPEAVDQTLTLTYKLRPTGSACACDDMASPDLSGRKCLTGDINSTDEGVSAMTPAQMGRLSRIGAWHRDAVAGNTGISADHQYVNVLAVARDIELAERARDAFARCLDDLYAEGTLAFAPWAPTSVTARYAIVQIGDSRLLAQTAGTTDVTAPAVPAIIGGTVVDGTVTWEYLGPVAEIMWDAAFDGLESDWVSFAGMGSTPAVYAPPFDVAKNLATVPFGTAVASGDAILCSSEYLPGGAEPSASANWTAFVSSSAFTVGPHMRVLATSVVTRDGVTCDVQSSPDATTWTTVGTCTSAIATATGGVGSDIFDVFYFSKSVEGFAKRYISSMDAVRAAAGITKKADASIVAGDGCWRDTGAAYWWEITGSTGGAYAPAFTNEPCFSSRKAGCGGYFATHEFAFQINVKCEDQLKEGDEIKLSIGDAGWPSTYQVGDTLYLPVIAAQDLYLAGGEDGDNIQTWHVEGSVDGAFPAYALDSDAPLPYSASGLGFSIAPGGIKFEAGDMFRFAIEGGHYRWRKDSGAWSAPAPIPASAVALSDGLSAGFATGASPSFAAGDLYRFRALQPSALSNVVSPDIERWTWSGTGATLTASLGSIRVIDCAALAFHSLPSGATVTLSGSADGILWDWSEALPWRAGVMAVLFTEKTAAWLKLEIAGATGGAIGWAWAGQALATEYSAECLLRRDYAMERGAGLNPAAAFLGATRSGDIEWRQGSLTDTDLPGILAMLDHLKTNGDEPMILIPQATRPEEAWPVRVLLDAVDMPEDGGYQPNTGRERRYGLTLPVKGVVA